MKHRVAYTVCVILELFVFLAGSTNVEHKAGESNLRQSKEWIRDTTLYGLCNWYDKAKSIKILQY